MRKSTQLAAITAILAAGIAGGVYLRSVLADTAAPRATDAGPVPCDQVAAGFTEYALLNVGDSFQGLPLTGCHRSQTDAKYDAAGNVREPATDFFSFFYGSCAPAPCYPPLEISVDPPCAPTVTDGAKKSAARVRGVDVIVNVDDSVRIEQPEYSVTIFTGAPWPDDATNPKTRREKGLSVLEALRGANAPAAGVSTTAPLDGGSVAALARGTGAALDGSSGAARAGRC